MIPPKKIEKDNENTTVIHSWSIEISSLAEVILKINLYYLRNVQRKSVIPTQGAKNEAKENDAGNNNQFAGHQTGAIFCIKIIKMFVFQRPN